MLQRRVLAPVLALAVAATACKKSDPAPATASGSAVAITGSDRGSDVGSATPKPGDAITRPFFYKVEKGGKTSYLLGTWHLGVDADQQLPKPVWDAFAGATTFAMEVDPADPAGLTSGLRTDGKTLEDELGPEYWAKLEAVLGSTATATQKMKPFAAAMLIQLKDVPHTVAMELSFVTKAKEAKKQLVFLEPAKLQIQVLEKWIDVRVLEQVLDDTESIEAKMQEALTAYLAGDDAVLVNMLIDHDEMKEAGYSDAEIAAATEDLLYHRNAAWIPALDEMFTQGGSFVAVGAGHLIGPKSVVELLAAKGYTITRVGA